MKIKRYTNGDIYFGQLRENHMQGLGALLRPDSYMYIGKVVNK